MMPEPNAKTSDAVVSQEQLLPFLLNPRSYPHRPRMVRLAQTHASFVVIAPPFVYKVKKSVNFGFLNFSTLEKRRRSRRGCRNFRAWAKVLPGRFATGSSV